ncbi:YndM family protein [Parageobacillus thermoglucosidasius]|uniref:YndM family protein n=1 Tax=Parageobacillus thermoglucosidasius TaxID=1426 RepID=UPI003B66EB63
MKHIVPLAFKFVAWSVALLSLFAIFDAPLLSILIMTAGTTAIAYIIGDLWILPRFGNFAAAIADVPLAFLLIWFASSALFGSAVYMAYASFFSALAIGAIEAFFHLLMEERVLDEARREQVYRWNEDGSWATEFAEEYENGQGKDGRT